MKSKWATKILAVCIAAITTFSMGGCGVKKVDDSPETIEVLVYNAGYGIDWFTSVKKQFETQTDYKVEYRELVGSDNIESMVRAGGSNTTVDLFLVSEEFARYIHNGNKMVDGYDYCLEPLDEVYNYTPEGESKSIGEKMWKTYRDTYSYDVEINGEIESHYYVMPWASGFTGLMYNTQTFADVGLTTPPRTTDELVEYANTLKTAGKTAFTHSSDAGYWEYMYNTWWAQYETLQGIDNFYNGKISDMAIPDAVSSIGIFDQKGILESLKAVSACIDPSKGFTPETVEALDYVTSQARFLAGQAAMMPSGDWLENEMKKVGGDTSKIMPMRTPIISAIADKLSFADSATAVREQNLRALVDYVDGGSLPTYAAENIVSADAAIVAKARKVNYTLGSMHAAAIPVYATAKAGAKEFLKFLYSDTSLAAYMNTTSGSLMPFEFDYKNVAGYASLSDFAKYKLEIMSDAEWFVFASHYPSAFVGGLQPIYRSAPYEILLGSRDNSTRKTPEKLVSDTKDYYKSRMGNVLRDSGLV